MPDDGREKEAARKLSLEGERRRSELWDSPPLERIDRIDPFKLVSLLKVDLDEPEEISLPGRHLSEGNIPSKIAGYIDRRNNVIAVARRFQPETRRFTLAHELGHWQLHKGSVYFRDFPLIAGDRSSSRRPLVEQQANRFAEELLMPAELVKAYFVQVFGLPTLRDRRPDEVLARLLDSGVRQKVTSANLTAKGRDWMAALAAEFENDPLSLSLAARFRVSRMAMSIRLMKLGLV